MQIRLAARNVFRNRRRTLFSILVIGIGTALLSFVLGFVGEALSSTQRSLACESGSVQLADPRIYEGVASPYEALIPPEILSRAVPLIESEPDVIGVTWQLDFAGLIGDESGSTLVIGRGVIPCNCVEDYECIVTDGAPLAEDSAREAILGRALARLLDVAPGDRVNIATGTVSGNFNAATVRVVGLLTYSLESVEEQLALFPLPFVQRLLRTEGVERILVGLADLAAAAAVANRLTARLAEEGIPLAVRTWQELNESYASLESFYSAFSGLAAVSVAVLVFFSVLEVLTMSFLERTREIGTVRAFGAERGRVFRGFLLEGGILGGIGGTLGAAVGAVVALSFNAIGFTWTPPGAAIPQAIRLQIDPSMVLIPFATAIVATLISALYPAWRNARLPIVDALRSR